MRLSKCLGCGEFPCGDVRHECYVVPEIDVEPEGISMVMISEAAPADCGDVHRRGIAI